MSGADLFDFRLFNLAVKLGSISQAGDVLNLSRTAASKRISTFEDYFGGNLLIRKKEGVFLTEKGKVFHKKMKEILDHYFDLHDLMKEQSGKRVTVNIFTSYALSSFYLPYALKAALQQVDVNVKITVSDVYSERTIENYDVVLFSTTPHLADYNKEKIFERSLGLFASKEYLKQNGTPTGLGDLVHHRIISYGQQQQFLYGVSAWPLSLLKEGPHIKPSFIFVNSLDAMIRYAEEGLGIIGVSLNLTERLPSNLVHIMRDHFQGTTPIYLMTPQGIETHSLKGKFTTLLKEELVRIG